MRKKNQGTSLRFTTEHHDKKKRFQWKLIVGIGFLLVFAIVSTVLILETNDYNINKILGKPEETTLADKEKVEKDLPELTSKVNVMIGFISKENTLKQISIVHANLQEPSLSIASLPITQEVTIENTVQSLTDIYQHGGARMLTKAVAEYGQIIIQKYVLIPEKNFQELVSKLGGVTIELPKAIDYMKDDMVLNLKQGEQRLTGNKLFQYMQYPASGQSEQLENQSHGISALVDSIITLDHLLEGNTFFEKMINLTDSNISVTDYEESETALEILLKSEKRIPNKLVMEISQFKIEKRVEENTNIQP